MCGSNILINRPNSFLNVSHSLYSKILALGFSCLKHFSDWVFLQGSSDKCNDLRGARARASGLPKLGHPEQTCPGQLTDQFGHMSMALSS